MPTIEKLLNADWKEKLLDKSTVGAGQLKGQIWDFTNNFTIYRMYHLYNDTLWSDGVFLFFLN